VVDAPVNARALLRSGALAAAVALVASGCGGASSIVRPHGSEADRVAGVWWLMFGLAVAVYVVVAGLIVYATVHGRRAKASALHENRFVWIGGVIVPALVLIVLAIVTVHSTAALRQPEPGELRVDVVGKRWWWDVRYPGHGVRTANEIHLPAGQPVDIVLTSDNVIHSFWVPELAGKEDTIPGQVNHLQFTAKTPGTYRGFCAEYCGIQHAHMGFTVVVESPAQFGRWLTREAALTPEPSNEQEARGQLVFETNACAGCHTIRGTSATGRVGPDLTDIGARSTIGAAAFENTPENLDMWIRDAPALKPGVLMPSFRSLSVTDISAMVAYLEARK
jgi:cytochrome c oxidase subunit 2